jgi:hypothetical protein
MVVVMVEGQSMPRARRGDWQMASDACRVVADDAVLICTIPLLASFFDPSSSTHANLASYLSTTFCFGNLLFLGLAQRDVGKVIY